MGRKVVGVIVDSVGRLVVGDTLLLSSQREKRSVQFTDDKIVQYKVGDKPH